MKQVLKLLWMWAAALVLAVSLYVPQGLAAVGPNDDLTVSNYTLISKQRVGRTYFVYTFKADIANSSVYDYQSITATITNSSSGTVMQDGSLSFPDVSAGGAATSTDTFSFKQNRLIAFSWDNITFIVSATQASVEPTDTDNDGTPDDEDGCPTDPNKTEPGTCGCGVADTDTDTDGTPDCIDSCPNDPNKTAPGICGCGVIDADTDGDGVADCNDNCPNDPEKIEPGTCGCGVADMDTDADGTPDCSDGCPNDPNKIAPGICGCGVIDTDTDGDGVADCNDNCPNDPEKIEPGSCGCGVADMDTDTDGTPDCSDGCPNDPNKTEPGSCGCGVVDTDTDGDGIADCNDNCPEIANADQADTDADGDGDVCDTDTPINITGVVTGSGALIAGATVTIGTTDLFISTTTTDSGVFTITSQLSAIGDITIGNNLLFPVKVEAQGYTTGYFKVAWVNGQNFYEGVEVILLPITTEIDENDELASGVNIVRQTSGGSETIGKITISDDVIDASGYTGPITGKITYIDPTTSDITSIPGGDLLALQGNDPNNPEDIVSLESLGMMEFDLVDANGVAVKALDGTAEICMKLPDGIDADVDETIPLWHYDPDQGLWIEEGSGTVSEIDGELWICGSVEHFTWWNYDRPVTDHACFKFQILDLSSGNPISYSSVYAEGVNYDGTSPARPCDCDSDDPSPCPGSSMYSFTLLRSTATKTYNFVIYTLISGRNYYFMNHPDQDTYPGAYRLTTDESLARRFETPTLQGSCLNSVNVENCSLLPEAGSDTPASDGTIIVDTQNINFAPSIYNLTIPAELEGGATIEVSADVTDINDGDTVSVTWSAGCGSITDLSNISDTIGPVTVSAQYTAPETLSYCRITVTATDSNGLSSTAYQNILVKGDATYRDISGILYGPDGNSVSGQDVTLLYYYTNEDESEVFETVTTDGDGRFTFENVPICMNLDGEATGFRGYLETTLSVGNDATGWTANRWISLDGCSNEDLDISSCSFNINYPLFWGTVSGAYYGSDGNIDTSQSDSLYLSVLPGLQGSLSLWTEVPMISGKYGPVSGPVSSATYIYYWDGTMEWASELSDLTTVSQSIVRDFGPVVTVNVSGTVFGNDGNPLAGATVYCRGYDNEELLGSTTTGDNGQYSFSALTAPVSTNSDLDWSYMYAYITVEDQDLTQNKTRFYFDEKDINKTVDVNGQGCTVNGRVVDPTGIPIEGAVIDFSNDGRSGDVTTGENGEFSLSGLSTGMIYFIINDLPDEYDNGNEYYYWGYYYSYFEFAGQAKQIDMQINSFLDDCSLYGY
ncbi:carboxypeptidase regulatory-like domain-containing protein [Desulfobacter curvatus]|uniref:carboxypeptidase regulatory-like domain-containing protein n=1 Tax=Desulfobacter curvatus TaxID=2290 RepID=UPI000368E13B|nr:carboxypeptidase regulatory-like domain-containing protein [Desulfobacter curvatus]